MQREEEEEEVKVYSVREADIIMARSTSPVSLYVGNGSWSVYGCVERRVGSGLV